MTANRRIRSDLARSTADTVTVLGFDLIRDLMGRINLGDMAFLELKARLPDEAESTVFNAMLLSLVEHGITPNTLAARLTYVGAPESLQASVAAGLLGLGSVFVGSIEGAARMLQEAMDVPDEPNPETLAAKIVSIRRERREQIPGLGHPIHKPVDPRTVRLFQLADENGLSGAYVDLMQLVGQEVSRQTGKTLPINVTGAIGALASEMEIPWQICRGLGVMARSIGLVGHVLEEMHDPMAWEVWERTARESESKDVS